VWRHNRGGDGGGAQRGKHCGLERSSTFSERIARRQKK
jgi:hypothetical protein